MHKVLPLARPTPFTLPHLYALSIDTSIQAGFPSPAEDHSAKRIDVLEKLIRHPQATYQRRVKGDSMRDEIRQTSLIPSNSTITHCGIPGPM